MKRKNQKNQQKSKEEIAEDYCFICKDGGDLLICDYKQCLKSYHFDCVQKDASFSTSKEKWVCGCHSCMVCHKVSQFQCYCCPRATCWNCVGIAELVNIKGKYGFCSICLKLALMVEDNRDADSDGEKVDFRDRETYEGLFMEYYKIIREREGFNTDNLLAARNRLETGKNILSGSEFDESGDEEEEGMSSDEDMDNMRGNKRQHKNKRFKKGLHLMHCVRSKRMQFCGWGSKPLIQFLKSIGKDTSEKLSQHDVYFIICKYITSNNLHDPKKKKKIVLDECLQSIFRKKTVNKNKIFGLLETHFVENLEESEEEESEYEEETPLATCKTRKMSKSEKGSLKKDAIETVHHSCYASVTAENIKHVYLRRSLVYELSKQRESFERKVIGSFVRVKSDPHDFYQRNSHQLVQVTGIMKFLATENHTEIILCGSKIPKEISVSLLSDADFSEEECEDLRQKVKDGLVQKPTVVQLKEKARSLHADITKHWIARELKILDRRIEQANEKGWRREFFEYSERKKLLETPLEQARLLENYPIVIPDVADIEPKKQDTADEQDMGEALPLSIFSRNPDHKSKDVVYLEPTIRDNIDEQQGNEALPESIFPADPNEKSESTGISSMVILRFMCENYAHTRAENKEYCSDLFIQEGKQNLDQIAIPVLPHYSAIADKREEPQLSIEEHPQQILLAAGDRHNVTSQIDADRFSSSACVNQSQPDDDTKQATSKEQKPLAAEVIELDSDDDRRANGEKQKPSADEVIDLDSDDDNQPNAAAERQTLEDPESCVWLMSGADGVPRGNKYSLSLLKRWSEITNYALGFKVWKENQSQAQAIPLGDAVKLAFKRT